MRAGRILLWRPLYQEPGSQREGNLPSETRGRTRLPPGSFRKRVQNSLPAGVVVKWREVGVSGELAGIGVAKGERCADVLECGIVEACGLGGVYRCGCDLRGRPNSAGGGEGKEAGEVVVSVAEHCAGGGVCESGDSIGLGELPQVGVPGGQGLFVQRTGSGVVAEIDEIVGVSGRGGPRMARDGGARAGETRSEGSGRIAGDGQGRLVGSDCLGRLSQDFEEEPAVGVGLPKRWIKSSGEGMTLK